MDLHACIAAASEAVALLLRFPALWLGVSLAFFICVEALMFIPYAGFVLKLSVAAIVSAQSVGMFATAASGATPSPLALLGAFGIPVTSQLALVAAALIPFGVGLGFLYFKAGASSLRFFFGHLLKEKQPARPDFLQFKIVMLVVGLPFALLPGAIAVKGLVGMAAVSAALSAAAIHWLPILLLTAIVVGAEWLMVQLPSVLPKKVAIALSCVLMIILIAWSFAITYTVSARVFTL